MSTIRNTVSEALRANRLQSYESAAQPVVRALENRERAILNNAQRVLRSNGITGQRATDILTEVGLVERPAPAAQAASPVTGNGDLASQVSNLVGLVGGLVEFAQQHGFRPTPPRR